MMTGIEKILNSEEKEAFEAIIKGKSLNTNQITKLKGMYKVYYDTYGSKIAKNKIEKYINNI